MALGAVVATAAPAAATSTSSLTPTSVSYVDSAVPGANLPPTSFSDLPVGAFAGADGTVHQTKTYVSFTIKSLVGHKAAAASLLVHESTVADCTTPRDTRAVLTESAAKPTWNKQPAEQLDLGVAAPQPTCPANEKALDWNVAAAINTALQAGRTTITLELRAPDNEQADPRFLRHFQQNPTLSVTFESAPDAPKLQVNFQDCGTAALSVPRRTVDLVTLPQSATEPRQDITVDYWPVDHPDQITENTINGSYSGGQSFTYVDPATLVDGTTYAWRARGSVDGLVGPWSKTCRFTADYTAPPNPPLVSSPDYPSPGAPDGNGGSGIPGTMTFRPNGDSDAVRYWYGSPGNPFLVSVDASHKGGPVTFSYTPNGVGPSTMAVVAQDAAGNTSPAAVYTFNIKDNRPVVTCGPTEYVGLPRTCVLSPGKATPSAVVGYAYSVGNGFTDVSVEPNGTATVQVPTTHVGDQTLEVDAHLANGNVTASAQVTLTSLENAPTVTGPTSPVGINRPVTFTMHAVLPGSVTFTYSWLNGPSSTVPVGADGTATVTVTTPSTPYGASLLVRTTTASGVVSDPGGATVSVESDVPVVSSTDYPEYQSSGQIGRAGTFTFAAPLLGVTSYRYTFDGGDPVTVPAGNDGKAQVSLIPKSDNHLVVAAIYADGVTSATYDYAYMAFSYAPFGYCDEAATAGEQTTCYVFPNQNNAVAVNYSVDGAPPVTVPITFFGQPFTVAEPDHPVQITITTTDQDGHTTDPGAIDLAGAPAS